MRLSAHEEALTVVAQEHAVYKSVRVGGLSRPTRTKFASCQYGLMSKWRDSGTVIGYS